MAQLTLLATLILTGAQSPFQGVVTGSYYDESGKPAMDYTQTIKGRRMRTDMAVGGMEVSSLFDYDANTMTSIMHTQRVYMVMNLNKAAGSAGNPSAPRITATGQSETIAGLRCDHYLIGDKQDVDICAAKGMGFGVPQGRGPMGRGQPGNLPVEYEQLARQFKDGFFPMKMEHVEGGRRRLVVLVKTVERKAIPDATFAMPAGYTEMKIPGMP